MARKGLSERQQKILQYIAEYIHANTRPPTIREIGRNVKISSTSVVNYNLSRLQDKGLIERDAEVSRGIRLTEQALALVGVVEEVVRGLVRVPLKGSIVASEKVESFPEAFDDDDIIEIGANWLGNNGEGLYALRVSGDSMIDAMVNDGDIVILRSQTTARNGDMVAAWVDEETTLKYFFNEGDRIRLQPANPTMKPFFYDPKHVQVQGKVEMVIRQP